MPSSRTERSRSALKDQLTIQLHDKAKEMVQGGNPNRETRGQYLAKVIVGWCNGILNLMGVVCIAAAIYLLVADFGDLDKGYFLGGGTMLMLFGLLVYFLSYLGGQGVYYRGRITKHTHWKGPRIIKYYQVFLVMGLIAEVLWVYFSQDALLAFYNTAKTVSAGGNPPLTSIEQKVGEKFDAFFFGATSQCATVKYEWFWGFVNTRCAKYDENMSQKTCQRCSEYSVVICAADTRACYADPTVPGNANLNPACPYVACRQGILQFVIDRFPPFSYFAIFMIALQLTLIASNFVLICAKHQPKQRNFGQYDESIKAELVELSTKMARLESQLEHNNMSEEERAEQQRTLLRMQQQHEAQMQAQRQAQEQRGMEQGQEQQQQQQQLQQLQQQEQQRKLEYQKQQRLRQEEEEHNKHHHHKKDKKEKKDKKGEREHLPTPPPINSGSPDNSAYPPVSIAEAAGTASQSRPHRKHKS